VRKWGLLLGGLLVWAAQFFLLYGIVSIFPGTMLARILAIAVTIAALAACGWIIFYAWKIMHSAPDEVDRWIARSGFAVALISLVSIIWQGLPAVLN
jgi:hypothetical protein